MNIIRKALLGVSLVTLLTGCGKDPFTVRGELVRDYVQKLPTVEVYRIYVETDKGMVTYPFLIGSGKVSELDEMYTSREESGIRGDMVAINPVSNVMSLNEVILFPGNLKKIE